MLNAYALAVFIFLQLADGFLTYCGISYTPLGIVYEANPIAIFLMQKAGVIAALVFLKFSSIAAGRVLYYNANNSRVAKYGLHMLNAAMFFILISHLTTLDALAKVATG